MPPPPRLRRRRPCFVQVDDAPALDLAALMRGACATRTAPAARLLCPLTGEAIALAPEALAALARLPGDAWLERDEVARATGLDAAVIDALAERGVLLREGGELDGGEAALAAVGWHPLAALYHAHTAWSGIDAPPADEDAPSAPFEALAARHGPPPGPHGPPAASTRLALPPAPLDTGLAALMRRRRTTRHFDPQRPIALEDAAWLLRGMFGTLGTQALGGGVVGVKRLSPSGGALHPIEGYVLARAVDGLPCGLYRYDGGAHALEPLEALDAHEALALGRTATAGQHYFADAAMQVVLAARADRGFWKYREHAKAYKVLLLDAGHLGQTGYLLATERGLGAFFTAAVNDHDLAARLRLPPAAGVALGIWGCGHAAAGREARHLQPTPWEP